MLVIFVECGLLDKVMFFMDIICCLYLKVNGGSGFSYLVDLFVFMLLVVGIFFV